ncbi:MAG: energy transducer TonB [Pseudomonadota bacterium]
MRNNFFSFLSALIIHALLFAALFFSLAKKTEIPPVSVINVINLDQAAQEKKSTKHHDLKPQKNQKETLLHFHEKAAQDSRDAASQKVVPIYNPLPQIPDDLRQEAFASSAVARFYIANDGQVLRVELIKPCANPRLNHLLLKSLKNWKFATSTTNSTQDIRVNFSVE